MCDVVLLPHLRPTDAVQLSVHNTLIEHHSSENNHCFLGSTRDECPGEYVFSESMLLCDHHPATGNGSFVFNMLSSDFHKGFR